MRNASDVRRRGRQNTRFMICNFFPTQKSWLLWDNLENCGRPGQAAGSKIIRRMRIVCWKAKATNIHSEYVTFSFFFPHGHNGYTNAPRRDIRTLPVLLDFCQFPFVPPAVSSCCACRPLDGVANGISGRLLPSGKGLRTTRRLQWRRLLSVRSRGHGFQSRWVQDIFPFTKRVGRCEAHPASCLVCTGDLYRGYRSRGV